MKFNCAFGQSRALPFLVVLVILLLTQFCEPAAKKAKGKSRTKSRNAAAALNQNCNEGFAFHNDTEKCLEIDQQGPCSEQMKFYEDPETPGFGDCECERSDCSDQNPSLYWQPDDRCYTAYEIGPCKSTEWLIQNASLDAECRKNPCLGTTILTIEPDRIEIAEDVEGVNTTNLAKERETEEIEMEYGVCTCTARKNTTIDDCLCMEHEFIPSFGTKDNAINSTLLMMIIFGGMFWK